MKWKKLGKIFDPTQHKLPNGCIEFAQSPQTLVFDDFVRIYFSTRKKDSNGKYLSHIAFVDMDLDLKNMLRISTDTVIELGELGCFDEHGIFPINLVRDKDKILAYTCGWNRRVSVSVETSIGLALSKNNGLTFEKIGKGPILSSSLNEPFLVGDGFVNIYNDTYHMWYIYGTRWIDNTEDNSPARVYKIAHATSKDGMDWKRDSKQIISDKLNAQECQALPTVIQIDEKYHMYFCYRQSTGFRKNKDRGYRIGYAYSDDLIHWTRNDDKAGIDVTEGAWDSDMQCYPHIFSIKNKTYLLYNGNEFGRLGFGLAVLED
jgi:hypothetical protein